MNDMHIKINKSLEKNKPSLLIIEDDFNISNQLKRGLSVDYEISTAFDSDMALMLLQKEMPAIIILDLTLPPRPNEEKIGFQLLDKIEKLNLSSKVIAITENRNKKNFIKALQIGAHDFYYKPIVMDEIKFIIKRAFLVHNIEKEKIEYEKKPCGEIQFKNLIGQNLKMQEIFNTIRKVAKSNIPVLITGESGTGKELISRAIHNLSDRKKNSFIAINCGAIPENLLESELFGHEKGSFTGAYTQQKGKVEYASGGTLFLDEIGELSPVLQVKLLRFLQEHIIDRIGGKKSIQVDTRIIAATQKDLLKASQNGDFRKDLYYRLSVVTIDIPPLREREDDVLLIAKYYLNQFSHEINRKLNGFNSEAIDTILEYTWPGNIRELENKIKRAIIMGEGPWITPQDLDFKSFEISHNDLLLKEAKERVEKNIILRALNKYNGNMTHIASKTGVSKPTLYKLIRKYGLER